METGSKFRLALLGLIVTGLLTGCSFVAQKMYVMPPYEIGFDRMETHWVAMDDGTRLHTNVYFPEGEGPWPVIVVRNPYNMMNFFKYIGRVMTRYGYVVVHQDTRGRFASEGTWYPLVHERNDGVDLLEWVVAQSWQDGNIGLFGPSYLGAVQWVVADLLPPEVKTMAIQVIGSNMASILYQDGMFRPELFSFWASFMPDESIALGNGRSYRRMIRHDPQIEADVETLGVQLDWYREWLRSPDPSGPIWEIPEAKDMPHLPERVQVPILSLGGWYDLFTREQLDDFSRLNTRNESRLIVGPWTHLMGMGGDGLKEFPGVGDANIIPKLVNWFDHHLKGEPLAEWGPVLTYAIGEDGGWHAHRDWPVETQSVELFLDEPRYARSCESGTLVSDLPWRDDEISYIYDPENPVPTVGGNGMLAFILPTFSTHEPSNRNQRGLCKRDDVLSFTSAPLQRPLHILGESKLRVVVASTAGDTGFTAKLIEIDSRGRALNVADGITSLRYRNGATYPVSYAPGEMVEITIDLWPVEWRFSPGSRIRVDVSSSNFPAYHRHTNTERPWYEVAKPLRAEQTIYTGPESGSALLLPEFVPPERARHSSSKP